MGNKKGQKTLKPRLCNKKHRFYDTALYHNYGAYLNTVYNLDTTAEAVQKAVHTVTINFY